MASTTNAISQSPKDTAIALCCAKNYHQVLWLPETPDHPRLRVTFSTSTNFDDSSLPAVLSIGPMFGSRYGCLDFDKLARDYGVRLICTDRPGMGGSTPVPLKLRMKAWLKTVPVLLRKVGVEHVSLFTHSAGAMYTLNTLVRHRSILDPKAPYVAFLGPFVSTTDSNATLVNLLTKLPESMLDSWSSVSSFVNTKIMPVSSWSGGLFSSTAAFFNPPASTDLPGAEPASTSAQDAADKYGVDQETAKVLEGLTTKYMFTEDTTSANEEAKMCLQSSADADWGAATDYMACIKAIAEAERSLDRGECAGKLRVDAFFGASDVMIGKQGQEFFERCWRQDSVGVSVDFETKTCEGTNHDTVLIDLKKGGLRSVFEKVAGLHASGS